MQVGLVHIAGSHDWLRIAAVWSMAAMSGFVAVAADDVADIDELKSWVTYGLDYAKLLPAK